MARRPAPIRGTGPAADALRQWDATGRSRTELGRIIGRDTKVFRDVASGAKPYRELAGAIGSAARGHEQLAGERGLAARRTTKGGELAATRGMYRTPAGVLVSGASSAQHARILAQLRAMNADQRAVITVTITQGTTPGGRDITPDEPDDITLGGEGGLNRQLATGGKRTNVDAWIDHLIDLINDGEAGAVDSDSDTVTNAGGVTSITAHIR